MHVSVCLGQRSARTAGIAEMHTKSSNRMSTFCNFIRGGGRLQLQNCSGAGEFCRIVHSAAMSNAAQYRQQTEAMLVSETIGEKPNSYQESEHMMLPHSRWD